MDSPVVLAAGGRAHCAVDVTRVGLASQPTEGFCDV